MCNKRKTKYTRSSAYVLILTRLHNESYVTLKSLYNELEIASITFYKYIQEINTSLEDFNLGCEISKSTNGKILKLKSIF